MGLRTLFNIPKICRFKRKSHSKISNKCTLNKNTELGGKNKLGRVNVCDTKIGFGSYILSGKANNGIIGKFVSIGHNFQVIDDTHPIDFISSYPGFYKTKNTDIFNVSSNIEINEKLLLDNGKSFFIGNDVWIGDNVTIKGGVRIGDGAVIGMNSLVTKDVPPYAIVGGVPAKIIKYRFDDKTVEKLLSLKWWDWELSKIEQESQFFNDIDTFLKRNTIK